MSKRQSWMLVCLALLAVVDLFTVRIALPVMRYRWPAFPAMSLLERWESACASALMAGAVVFVLAFGWAGILRKESPLLRKLAYTLFLLMGAAEIFRLIWTQPPWVDSTRHVIAVVVVIVIAADALLHGTALARAAIGLAAVALFGSTLYRGIVVYAPMGTSMRWLATMSETTSLLVPWALSATVARRQRDDIVALVGAVIAVVLSAIGFWGLSPAIHQRVAQAIGFRFGLPPLVHVLTVGPTIYFLIKALRSPMIPAQVPWAYVWLMASGIQMNRPYVQMGALVALAVLAWTPPLRLPTDFRRCSSLRRPPDEEPGGEAATSPPDGITRSVPG